MPNSSYYEVLPVNLVFFPFLVAITYLVFAADENVPVIKKLIIDAMIYTHCIVLIEISNEAVCCGLWQSTVIT
jgi:hypothetical protein